jgi:hypothetical protein
LRRRRSRIAIIHVSSSMVVRVLGRPETRAHLETRGGPEIAAPRAIQARLETKARQVSTERPDKMARLVRRAPREIQVRRGLLVRRALRVRPVVRGLIRLRLIHR